MRATYKISHDLFKELSDKHPSFKRIYDHQLAYHRESQPWWVISDLSYDIAATTAVRQKWENG